MSDSSVEIEIDERIQFAESKMNQWVEAQDDVINSQVERSIAVGMASYFKGKLDGLVEAKALNGGGDNG